MRILLLHNPGAGRGDMPKDALVRLFEAAGHGVVYRSTKTDAIDPGDALAADVVVVGGGDGTVCKAVRALEGAARRIAVAPLGTANNIAHALGLMAPPEAVAQGLDAARERHLDVGVAEGPWGRRRFIEAVGVGLIAELVANGKGRGFGDKEREAYDRQAPQELLAKATPRRWRAATDGAALGEELLMLEALNIPISGPGLRLVGPERAGEGRLDVATLAPERQEAMAAWFETDRRAAPDALDVRRARQMTFEWSGGPLRIDDHFPDQPKEPSRVVARLEAEPLRILVPPAAE